MKKKVLSMILAAAMGASLLAGCGSSNDTKSEDNTKKDAADDAQADSDEADGDQAAADDQEQSGDKKTFTV